MTSILKNNKAWELIRYDLPRFFSNIWRFRKALWNHYWFDHHGTLMFLQTGIQHMADRVELDGLEVDVSRLKKVKQMRRLVELIKNYNEDLYIEKAEAELGPMVHWEWKYEPVADRPGYTELIIEETEEDRDHNRALIKRAHEIEREEWDEISKIIRGQDYSKFNEELEWNEQFDGTGIRGWWD